ncbi:MAG: hypothetical protein JXK04_02950, partial [Campylobacterales bacterium]|nr:hypothetical protein [Campylobacterales bacterium]
MDESLELYWLQGFQPLSGLYSGGVQNRKKVIFLKRRRQLPGFHSGSVSERGKVYFFPNDASSASISSL